MTAPDWSKMMHRVLVVPWSIAATYVRSGKASATDGQPVHVLHLVGAHRGNRLAGDDQADQVERVGGVDHHALRRSGRLAHAGQLLDGGGQGVLLTAEAADKTPAADQSAIFEPAQCPLDLAPGQAQTVANGQIPKQHAPAVEQLLGDRLCQVMAIHVSLGRWYQRPSAGHAGGRSRSAPQAREPPGTSGGAAA